MRTLGRVLTDGQHAGAWPSQHSGAWPSKLNKHLPRLYTYNSTKGVDTLDSTVQLYSTVVHTCIQAG